MRREIIEYNPNLKERAREFRNNPTPMEKKLWTFLKDKQINGFDLRRQKPIKNFIVDFYCSELKLAIEVDGSIHIGKEEADFERQKIIESYGIKFLRFTNAEVDKNIESVIETITNFSLLIAKGESE